MRRPLKLLPAHWSYQAKEQCANRVAQKSIGKGFCLFTKLVLEILAGAHR